MHLSDWESLAQCFLRQRWVRFGIIGFLATATYFCLGVLFVNFLHLPPLLGNAAAYITSFAVSYLGQALWTFGAAGSHKRMLPRFAAAQAIGLGINSSIIEICLRLGTSYPCAMLIAIVLVPIAVYFICKYWVFKK